MDYSLLYDLLNTFYTVLGHRYGIGETYKLLTIFVATAENDGAAINSFISMFFTILDICVRIIRRLDIKLPGRAALLYANMDVVK